MWLWNTVNNFYTEVVLILLSIVGQHPNMYGTLRASVLSHYMSSISSMSEHKIHSTKIFHAACMASEVACHQNQHPTTRTGSLIAWMGLMGYPSLSEPLALLDV